MVQVIDDMPPGTLPGEMRLFHEGEIDLAQNWLSA
jgi:hypothetical protein